MLCFESTTFIGTRNEIDIFQFRLLNFSTIFNFDFYFRLNIIVNVILSDFFFFLKLYAEIFPFLFQRTFYIKKKYIKWVFHKVISRCLLKLNMPFSLLQCAGIGMDSEYLFQSYCIINTFIHRLINSYALSLRLF